jgi:hypothetical protein
MASYKYTFTSGDTITPARLNDARDVFDIVNADIKSDAAIAGTKISPNFGSQNVVTGGITTVTGNSSQLRLLTSDNRGWRVGHGSTGSSHGAMYIQGTTDAFVSSFINAVDISTSGFVGVAGATSPTSPLTVATGSGQFTTGIAIVASTHSTSRRSAIACDDWILNQDTAGNGTKDFGVFQGSASLNRLYIGTTGNVGIGTVAPAARLSVERGHGTQSPSSLWRSAVFDASYTRNDNSDFVIRRISTGSTNYAGFVQCEDTSNNVTALSINPAGGDVGVGTSSPSSKLDVNGDVTITDKIIHSGDTNTCVRFPSADTFAVETSGSERLRVTSTGNVGINTSSPNSPLTVATGSGQFTTALDVLASTHATSRRSAISLDDWQINQDTTGGGTKDFGVYQSSAGVHRLYISTNGRVAIGTTNPNADALLDLTSTSLGFLPPRMTTAQRDAINTPTAGLVLYNTSTNKLQVRTNTAWADLH